ncbi:hypothetical protein EV183_000801 [Coemansia sp. RSA 2336]|nr:hypothetical protein EV183_000801 [Coemansia sp. RSA 2336]
MHGASAHRKLNMNSALRRQVLRNLTTDLIKYGRLETTVPRAKELRRLADKMITLGKRGTVHDRNQIQAYLYQPKTVVPLLMDTYAKRFADRPGGFTRVVPIGHRKGDHAPMAMIEILNTETPEAEVSFSYLVRSLANMQIREGSKVVDRALNPVFDAQAVPQVQRMFKRAVDEHKVKEKFAAKIRKAMRNAHLSAEQLQEYVDKDVTHVLELEEKEQSKKINEYVKEIWPDNAPNLK